MPEQIVIVIGLGNPGSKYENTRHNAGFTALDLFAKENGFPLFSAPKKLRSEISEGSLNGQKIVLVKPMTFMNLSGIAVKEAIMKYGLKNYRLIVVHDDIDIPLGKTKVSKNRGPGGHNGVLSIIKEMGTKDFTRIRIGILPEKKPFLVNVFVLRKPPEEQREGFRESIRLAVSEIKKEILTKKVE